MASSSRSFAALAKKRLVAWYSYNSHDYDLGQIYNTLASCLP